VRCDISVLQDEYLDELGPNETAMLILSPGRLGRASAALYKCAAQQISTKCELVSVQGPDLGAVPKEILPITLNGPGVTQEEFRLSHKHHPGLTSMFSARHVQAAAWEFRKASDGVRMPPPAAPPRPRSAGSTGRSSRSGSEASLFGDSLVGIDAFTTARGLEVQFSSAVPQNSEWPVLCKTEITTDRHGQVVCTQYPCASFDVTAVLERIRPVREQHMEASALDDTVFLMLGVSHKGRQYEVLWQTNTYKTQEEANKILQTAHHALGLYNMGSNTITKFELFLTDKAPPGPPVETIVAWGQTNQYVVYNGPEAIDIDKLDSVQFFVPLVETGIASPPVSFLQPKGPLAGAMRPPSLGCTGVSLVNAHIILQSFVLTLKTALGCLARCCTHCRQQARAYSGQRRDRSRPHTQGRRLQ